MNKIQEYLSMGAKMLHNVHICEWFQLQNDTTSTYEISLFHTQRNSFRNLGSDSKIIKLDNGLHNLAHILKTFRGLGETSQVQKRHTTRIVCRRKSVDECLIKVSSGKSCHNLHRSTEESHGIENEAKRLFSGAEQAFERLFLF